MVMQLKYMYNINWYHLCSKLGLLVITSNPHSMFCTKNITILYTFSNMHYV